MSVPKRVVLRAIRAQHAICRNFSLFDCKGQVCPFYGFLPQARELPDNWWLLPQNKWSESYDLAMQRSISKVERPHRARLRRPNRWTRRPNFG